MAELIYQSREWSKGWEIGGMENYSLLHKPETVGGLINSPMELTEIGLSLSAIRVYHAWAAPRNV